MGRAVPRRGQPAAGRRRALTHRLGAHVAVAGRDQRQPGGLDREGGRQVQLHARPKQQQAERAAACTADPGRRRTPTRARLSPDGRRQQRGGPHTDCCAMRQGSPSRTAAAVGRTAVHSAAGGLLSTERWITSSGCRAMMRTRYAATTQVRRVRALPRDAQNSAGTRARVAARHAATAMAGWREAPGAAGASLRSRFQARAKAMLRKPTKSRSALPTGLFSPFPSPSRLAGRRACASDRAAIVSGLMTARADKGHQTRALSRFSGSPQLGLNERGWITIHNSKRGPP